MKPLFKFLARIQGWPEEARRFAMVVCLFLAALAVFVSWGSVTSSKLSKISEGDIYALPPLPAETSSEKPGLVSSPLGSLISPLAGLGESFGVLGAKIVNVGGGTVGEVTDKILSVNLGKYAASALGFLTDIPGQIMNRLDGAADFAAEKLR